MSIKVAWDNTEQTAIRFDFEGKWNFLDFDFAVNECVTLLNEIEHNAALIFNVERSGLLAAGAVLESRSLRQPLPANHGTIIIAGQEAFAMATASIISRIYEELGEDFSIVESMTKARALVSRTLRQLQNA
jgi:hypothetical protein